MNLLDSLRETRITEKPVGIRISTGEDGLPIIEAHKSDQIKTLDQLLKAADVDLNKWEVERHCSNVWNQMSSQNGLVHLWQVKAHLKRKDLTVDCLRDVVQKGWAAFKQGLNYPISKIAKIKKRAEGTMVEFALPDLHLGKMAWTQETGCGNWDTKTAAIVYNEALDDLIKRSPDAEEAWLVVGNDFFNVDADTKTTTAGTVQDEDGRWQKTFIVGKELMMGAIGRLLTKYPKVKVIVVYGNHDRQRSFYLGECLSEAFRGVDAVDIDNRPLNRKYYAWGNTGLGYTHGDRMKAKDLSNLCQNEAREIWGKTTRFEMHLGHLHQDIVKTLGGAIIRWLPALCPPDSWHAAMGFTMAEKAAMALVYDKNGMQSTIVHYPEPKHFA